MKDDQLSLTRVERIILANQYRILEILSPDEEASFRQRRVILENGYEIHYKEILDQLSERPLPADAAKEIMDILDMYRALNDSWDRLTEKEGIEKRQLQFEGFDGNESDGRCDYVRFLVLTQRRWEEVMDGRPGFDFNSHSSVSIEIYRRMLRAWSALGNKHSLSAAEILGILTARQYKGSANA
jgi:uncharacterized protein YfbU (UPF0304 family)